MLDTSLPLPEAVKVTLLNTAVEPPGFAIWTWSIGTSEIPGSCVEPEGEEAPTLNWRVTVVEVAVATGVKVRVGVKVGVDVRLGVGVRVEVEVDVFVNVDVEVKVLA